MNRYQTATPRVAISFAALAMTAVTLGLALAPATVGPDSRHMRTYAATPGASAIGSVERPGGPIVVYGTREENTAFRPARLELAPPRQEG